MKTLIDQYIELAIKHGDCILEGDSLNGNKLHSDIMNAAKQILLKAKDLHPKFFATLKHENDSVKLWTATILLKTMEAESMAVLRQIAETNTSIHSLTAATTVDSWQKGMLTDIINWNEP